MRRNFIALIVFISIICAFPAQRTASAAPDGASQIALLAGEDFDLGKTDIAGPADVPIRDGPKAAAPVYLPDGWLAFRGIAPGTTLCSAASSAGPRLVSRFTVH